MSETKQVRDRLEAALFYFWWIAHLPQRPCFLCLGQKSAPHQHPTHQHPGEVARVTRPQGRAKLRKSPARRRKQQPMPQAPERQGGQNNPVPDSRGLLPVRAAHHTPGRSRPPRTWDGVGSPHYPTCLLGRPRPPRIPRPAWLLAAPGSLSLSAAWPPPGDRATWRPRPPLCGPAAPSPGPAGAAPAAGPVPGGTAAGAAGPPPPGRQPATVPAAGRGRELRGGRPGPHLPGRQEGIRASATRCAHARAADGWQP